VDKERDINSGLVGPLIVCKDQTAMQNDANTKVIGVGVIDEKMSWYNDETLSRTLDKDLNNNGVLFHQKSSIFGELGLLLQIYFLSL